MKDDNKFVVEGYLFSSGQEAELAKKEAETIRYLQKMNNMKNPKVMLQVYEKMVSSKLFVTPVGRTYLKNLQRQLAARYNKEDIPPVPVLNGGEPVGGSGFAVRKRMLEFEDVGHNYRKKLKVSYVVIGMLSLALAGMIALAATSKSPHILNYENALIDRYEKWEQELTRREEELNKNYP